MNCRHHSTGQLASVLWPIMIRRASIAEGGDLSRPDRDGLLPYASQTLVLVVLRVCQTAWSQSLLDVTHSVSPYVYIHLSQSLITVDAMHSTLQPCSSNQCDTARLESKLTRRFKTYVHLIP
jgi:hypothetical protein